MTLFFIRGAFEGEIVITLLFRIFHWCDNRIHFKFVPSSEPSTTVPYGTV